RAIRATEPTTECGTPLPLYGGCPRPRGGDDAPRSKGGLGDFHGVSRTFHRRMDGTGRRNAARRHQPTTRLPRNRVAHDRNLLGAWLHPAAAARGRGHLARRRAIRSANREQRARKDSGRRTVPERPHSPGAPEAYPGAPGRELLARVGRVRNVSFAGRAPPAGRYGARRG